MPSLESRDSVPHMRSAGEAGASERAYREEEQARVAWLEYFIEVGDAEKARELAANDTERRRVAALTSNGAGPAFDHESDLFSQVGLEGCMDEQVHTRAPAQHATSIRAAGRDMLRASEAGSHIKPPPRLWWRSVA